MPRTKNPEIQSNATQAAGRSQHMRGSADRDKATEGLRVALAAQLGRDPTPDEWDEWEAAFWGGLGEDFA